MIDALNAKLRIRKLLRLLDDERALLLAGRLDELPPLSAARDQIFQALGKGGRAADRAMAEAAPDIRSRAERNRRLLKAALEGMQAARLQLAQSGRSMADMQTYTASGKRIQVDSQEPLGGRRA